MAIGCLSSMCKMAIKVVSHYEIKTIHPIWIWPQQWPTGSYVTEKVVSTTHIENKKNFTFTCSLFNLWRRVCLWRLWFRLLGAVAVRAVFSSRGWLGPSRCGRRILHPLDGSLITVLFLHLWFTVENRVSVLASYLVGQFSSSLQKHTSRTRENMSSSGCGLTRLITWFSYIQPLRAFVFPLLPSC